MTIPRQLAPTMGPAHGGVEFLEGSLLGFEKLAILSDEEELTSLLFCDLTLEPANSEFTRN